jgi:hypothetical protein
MRFMMIVKASKESEADVLPTKELVAARGRFNQDMLEAGVLLAGEADILPPEDAAREQAWRKDQQQKAAS